MSHGYSVHRLDARNTVRDWLVSEAWSEPAADLAEVLSAEGDPWGSRGRWVLTNGPDSLALKRALAARHPLPSASPPVPKDGEVFSWAGRRRTWRRYHTDEDGLVDWSDFFFVPHYSAALAGVMLAPLRQGNFRLRVASTGPVVVYVGGRAVHRDTEITYMEPYEREVELELSSKPTPVVVATWQACFRETRHVLRMRLSGALCDVRLPDSEAHPEATRRGEEVLESVGFPRWAGTEGRAEISGEDGAQLIVEQGAGSRPVVLTGGRAVVSLEESNGNAPTTSMLESTELGLRVTTSQPEARVFREASVTLLPSDYRAEPRGDSRVWREELLAHTANSSGSLAAELARLAMGEPAIRLPELRASLDMIEGRYDCADFELVALMHLWHRATPGAWSGEWRARAEAAIQGFKYWIDQPGLDCMCYFTENHQLMFHVAETLAGEVFPEARFRNTAWSGAQHADHGTALCMDWISQRLLTGFSEFDSNAYMAIDVLALVSLVEFTRSPRLAHMAEALLDKLMFSLAVNSWRGIHGSSHARSYADALRSARLEETSGVQRVAWGMGALNEALLPAAVLATAHRYVVPDVIRRGGEHIPQQWWGRQRQTGRYEFSRDLASSEWEAASTVFRTPHVMLACLMDHRPGEMGLQQHVWGATLGPETSVFVNHPANCSVSSSARPNYWAGNRVLPRAAQDHDALIALYRLLDDDPMGFTHAWWPVAYLDEWRSWASWTACRRGEGYVALATEGGARLLESGINAHQELRPRGPGNSWVCQVGTARTHGSFDGFCNGLSEPRFGDVVEYLTPDGRMLELGWREPWLVDGTLVVATDFPHFDNPFCEMPQGAPRMVIEVDEARHGLDLEAGRRVTETKPD